jgi:hypothetical protein
MPSYSFASGLAGVRQRSVSPSIAERSALKMCEHRDQNQEFPLLRQKMVFSAVIELRKMSRTQWSSRALTPVAVGTRTFQSRRGRPFIQKVRNSFGGRCRRHLSTQSQSDPLGSLGKTALNPRSFFSEIQSIPVLIEHQRYYGR